MVKLQKTDFYFYIFFYFQDSSCLISLKIIKKNVLIGLNYKEMASLPQNQILIPFFFATQSRKP